MKWLLTGPKPIIWQPYMNYNDNDNANKTYPPGDDPGDMLEVGIMIDEDPDFKKTGQTASAGDEADLPDHSSQENPDETEPNDSLADDMPVEESQDRETPQQDHRADILNEIRNVYRRIDELTDHFEGKIKYDEHKNRIIDDLHEQLQDFRDGIIKKHLLSIITDIIKIIDDTRKFKSHYTHADPAENAAALMIDFMDQIISDLEDLFTFQGVYPFTCAGDTFDSHRQRIIKRIDTDLPEKNRLVAESLRPGYEWEGKVIRPEMVAVYMYNDTFNDKAGES